MANGMDEPSNIVRSVDKDSRAMAYIRRRPRLMESRTVEAMKSVVQEAHTEPTHTRTKAPTLDQLQKVKVDTANDFLRQLDVRSRVTRRRGF